MSTGHGRKAAGGRAGVDRWAAGREVLRAADPLMAALVEAEPGLDPDTWFDGLPADLAAAYLYRTRSH